METVLTFKNVETEFIFKEFDTDRELPLIARGEFFEETVYLPVESVQNLIKFLQQSVSNIK